MPSLFDPIQIGSLHLPNRVVMAPLTRCRAAKGRVPRPLNAEYYKQRASAGLILSEATAVTPMGVGYPDTPGIWSREQVEGWKLVTRAVHDAGGLILLQLWHVGRISDPEYLDGALPVAPSAIAPPGFVSLVRPKRPFVTPRALALEEIPSIVEQFRQGSENAQAAGFDGVEIHGANGYLMDQFLHPSSNQRTDEYGDSIENRARFMLEVTDAAISVWGSDRVGVHLAPRHDDAEEPEIEHGAVFVHLAKELSKRNVAFICAREGQKEKMVGPAIRKAFTGAYIANEGLTPETAQGALDSGSADAVAFGRLFIANPDLPKRIKLNAPLNTPVPATFYGSGPEGYTDYAAL